MTFYTPRLIFTLTCLLGLGARAALAQDATADRTEEFSQARYQSTYNSWASPTRTWMSCASNWFVYDN